MNLGLRPTGPTGREVNRPSASTCGLEGREKSDLRTHPIQTNTLAACQAATFDHLSTQGIGLWPKPWAPISRPVGPASCGIVCGCRTGLDTSRPFVLQCVHMTREQYEQRKRRLEEQLRAGIQLLESAYQAQVRALDLVWMLQAEEAGAGGEISSPAAPGAPAPVSQELPTATRPPHGQRTYAARDEIRSVFNRLPQRFTRTDVCSALGYTPDRGALFRVLNEMVDQGYIQIATHGRGKRATVYMKNAKAELPSNG